MLHITWCETEQMVSNSESDDEGELLYEQDEHVSSAKVKGSEPRSYRCINTNPRQEDMGLI